MQAENEKYRFRKLKNVKKAVKSVLRRLDARKIWPRQGLILWD